MVEWRERLRVYNGEDEEEGWERRRPVIRGARGLPVICFARGEGGPIAIHANGTVVLVVTSIIFQRALITFDEQKSHTEGGRRREPRTGETFSASPTLTPTYLTCLQTHSNNIEYRIKN
jgi:hypothetical protein